MIQRIQTIWLILAAAAAFFTCKIASFGGNIMGDDKIKVFKHFTATSNIVILILTVILGLAATITIFLYKNRKLQLRITLAALALSLIIPVLYYLQYQKFVQEERGYNITAIVSFLVPVFLILAAKGINNDQKLVKSLDRLR